MSTVQQSSLFCTRQLASPDSTRQLQQVDTLYLLNNTFYANLAIERYIIYYLKGHIPL